MSIMYKYYVNSFLPSSYNCLLKFISLIILLREVRKFLGEVLKISGVVQSHPRGGQSHLSRNPALRNSLHFMRHFSYRSQITFHPNDHSSFQDLADEIKAFEGLAHCSLVKYYGCEVHRVRKKMIT